MSTIRPRKSRRRTYGGLGRIAEQRQLMEVLIDALPCAVFVKDSSDLSYLRVNRIAEELFGIQERGLLGKTDGALFSQDEALRIQADDQAVIRSCQPGELFEERLLTKRGARWFCTTKVPVLGIRGMPDLLLTFSEDITERKEFQTTSAMWDQVFRHSERGIIIGSPAGTTLELMNPAFARMHGSTIEALAGTPLIEIFAPEVRPSIPAMFELVRRNGQHTFESICLRKDGNTYPVLVDATSVKDAMGNVHHRAIRIQDTSLLKSTERRLRADRTEAERASEAKNQFLSRMSHELRTPLNVILGFAQVMQLDELTKAQDESVGHILQAGRHLSSLIDETLDISRVESGTLALSLESVQVTSAVEEVVSLMAPLAEKSGIRLIQEGLDSNCHVLADRQRLNQVLLNLIANGIKYNIRGGYVRIECKETEEAIEILVSDTGIGFAKNQAHRLFAPFDRLGREAGPIEGTGLGLSLSKALVEKMGGSITAAPNPAAGSLFTVRLKKSDRPEVAVTAADGATRPHPGPTGLVLYIEDNLANFQLVERVLSRRPGMRVLPAMQAGIGLQLAHDHHPDVIILDLHLPDLSGEETLRRLLHSADTRAIPVIIATADATPRRLERLMKLGARAYLTKPLEISVLLETIDALLLEADADPPAVEFQPAP